MDISEPTLLKVEDRPETQGLTALLCSYTSRTVPRLPGHVYRIRGGSLSAVTADDNVSLHTPQNLSHSRRTQPSDSSHNERGHASVASQHYSRYDQLHIDALSSRDFESLNTWFDTTGCPVPDGKLLVHLAVSCLTGGSTSIRMAVMSPRMRNRSTNVQGYVSKRFCDSCTLRKQTRRCKPIIRVTAHILILYIAKSQCTGMSLVRPQD
jgi:hypothetical protein